ncbi:MAG TPA: hypothetical protein VMO81_04795 [Aestuariivirgaceae bacterium]|nr:hypothetical protein [Aestuariivirgaceae bacterium]
MVAPEDATDDDNAGERRAGRRRRMLKHVQVLSLDRKATSAVDLTLRNSSTFGAQLFGPAESLARIPDEFHLVAPGQLRMIRCRIVWKGEDMVGVSFRSDPGALGLGNSAGDAEIPPDDYHFDPETGAVIRTHPHREVRALERRMSASLGVKVEIAETGPESRVVLYVPAEKLKHVCLRLSRPD